MQNATDDNLQQSLDAMQANFDAFLHATQAAGEVHCCRCIPTCIGYLQLTRRHSNWAHKLIGAGVSSQLAH